MKDLVTQIGTSVATSITVHSRDLVVGRIGQLSFTDMTQVIHGKSPVRKIRMPGSLRAKAKWLSSSTNFLNEGKEEVHDLSE